MQFFIVITLILALVSSASGAELRGSGDKEVQNNLGAPSTYYCPDARWHVTCASGSQGCYAGNWDLCKDERKVRNVEDFGVCGGANWNGVNTVCNPGHECVFDNEWHSQCNPKANSRHYAQCGGMNYAGSVVCTEGNYCKEQNEYYSQCQQDPDTHPTILGGGVYVKCGDDGYVYCQSGTYGCYTDGPECDSKKEVTSTSFQVCGGLFWSGGTLCGEGYTCAPSTIPHMGALVSTCQPLLL